MTLASIRASQSSRVGVLGGVIADGGGVKTMEALVTAGSTGALITA